MCYSDNELFAPKGWICPKCGSVMAPTMPYCLFCCGGNNTPQCVTITANSTTACTPPNPFKQPTSTISKEV